MDDLAKKPLNTKKVFRKCGTCSQTFANLLNREFGFSKENEERAIDSLAGGIMNQGHQCGMLWGAALAIGAESYRQHVDVEKAIGSAILATQQVVDSFFKRSKTVNCRSIVGYDLSKFTGLVKFGLKVMLKGLDNSHCFNLAEDWAPEAIQAATNSLSQNEIETKLTPTSCASEVVKRIGGNEEEMVMVSGFAGGLGLGGNACGALSAAIWMKTLQWCKENPGKTPPYFTNKETKKKLKEFYKATDDEIICQTISGKAFKTLDDHSKFVKEGGCAELIQVLSN